MSGRKGMTASARVSSAVVGVLIVGVALVSILAYVSMRGAMAANADDALLREVQAYSAAIKPVNADDDRSLRDASRAYLQGRSAAEGMAMVLVVRLADGHVLSNSSVDLENAPANGDLLDPGTARRRFATFTFHGTEYRAASAPIHGTEGPVAVFQAATPTTAVATISRDFALALTLTSIAVVLAGAAVATFAAHRALRPLTSMARDASRITHSSLEERVSYQGPADELGSLAESLNDMLCRLENSFDTQRRFVADASHELRTPVAVIRGHVDMLRRPGQSDTDRAEEIRVIDDEITRMQRLLDDLLALARVQAAPMRAFQPLLVPTMLEEIAARAASLGTRHFRRRCEPDLWIQGDPDALEQALQNIVRNAVEHTGDDGTIELACSVEGDLIVIEIADDGPGIRDTDLPRVFDRFYRAPGPRHAESGGSGLGLAIARQLIQAHCGTVIAGNRETGGAVFRVELPRAETPTDDEFSD
ncbi:MAG: sensor histidine kinase [Coriobacteriia bacterium]